MLTSAHLRGPEDSKHAADRHCCRPVKLRLGWLQPAIGGRSPDSLVVPSIQPRRCCKPLIISLSRCLFCDLLCPLECKYPFVPNVVSSVAWMFSSFLFYMVNQDVRWSSCFVLFFLVYKTDEG